MTTDDPILVQGIAAAKAGDRHTARRLLTRAVRENPESELAWLWLSSVLDTPQAKAFCLREVLALNPDNRAAQKGLVALASAAQAPALVAQPPSDEAARPAPARRGVSSLVVLGARIRQGVGQLPPPRELVGQQRFWQVVVICLAAITLGLVAVLVFATLNGSSADEAELAFVPSPTPGPRGADRCRGRTR